MHHFLRDRERDRPRGAQKEMERRKGDETNKRETARKGEPAECKRAYSFP